MSFKIESDSSSFALDDALEGVPLPTGWLSGGELPTHVNCGTSFVTEMGNVSPFIANMCTYLQN